MDVCRRFGGQGSFLFIGLLLKENPENELHEHPAKENAPSTRRTPPLMNIPAADIVNAGASAAKPRDVDPVEVAILAEAADPGTTHLRLQELAADQPIARPAVAANPAAGPELLAWLRALDAPTSMKRSGSTHGQRAHTRFTTQGESPNVPTRHRQGRVLRRVLGGGQAAQGPGLRPGTGPRPAKRPLAKPPPQKTPVPAKRTPASSGVGN